jgi:dienelactone hydrolase
MWREVAREDGAPMKKKFKVLGAIAAIVLAVAVLGLAILKVNLDSGYFDGYTREAPLDARVAEETKTPEFVRTLFYYKGWRGEEVPALLAMPLEHKGPVPAIVFLHGIGQKKDFLDEIAGPFTKAGFAFASFDQYTRGERRMKDKSMLAQANAFRLRPAYTVNDTRRMIDYLETRPDIATNRIYLVGASYGAITGATAAAFDDRLKAAVLIYGGGNIPELLEAREIAAGVGAWMPLVKVLGWYFFGVSDPARYVGKISPRPVYLQNGTNDGLISAPAAKTLQDAAREPKKVQWYEGDHIGTDEAAVKQVLQDVLEYLLKVDADVVDVVVS